MEPKKSNHIISFRDSSNTFVIKHTVLYFNNGVATFDDGERTISFPMDNIFSIESYNTGKP